MKFPSRVVLGSVAALWFTAAVADDALRSNAAAREVIARADGVVAPRAQALQELSLDAYTGRYDVTSAVALVVDREGDALTIELPAAYGGSVIRLHATEALDTFTTDSRTRVVFERDSSARVLGLLLHTPNEVVAASKAPAKRGVVTIHDVSDEAGSSLQPTTLVRSF